jgi:hypothetical protein
MRLLAVLLLTACALAGADRIDAFGYHWAVPAASDWKLEGQGTEAVLHLIAPRGPLPGPRRPIEFALAAHFDYAHLSIDSATKEHVHNGVFHVYGGERVRISSEAGPPAFAAANRWYHVRLMHDGESGAVQVMVDGRRIPALHAIDLSLKAGRVGIGSFDETGDFKNVKIQGVPGSAEAMGSEPSR